MVALDNLDTMAAFESAVVSEQPTHFIFYKGLTLTARTESTSLLDHLRIDCSGLRFLDIGPGCRDSLDVWHERGATECAFVEKDPWFFTYNRLKPYAHGWRINQFWQLSRLPQGSFDFIWSRGAISCKGRYLRWFGAVGLHRWLRAVESLAAPKGQIVICPHGCALNWMPEVFKSRGYEPMPWIEGHSIAGLYPMTWLKSME